MMARRIVLIGFLFSFLFQSVLADEGMWLPILIKRLNQTDMEKKGLKLSADEIYSVNNSSLKDAIVNFGDFCTGEMVSGEGLVLTNHHCGFDAIQQHSSVENDYLTNGFWAKTKEEEKPTPGLTVTFLIRMEEVTEKVLGVLTPDMTDETREEAIGNIIDTLEAQAVVGTHYVGEIKPFFEGNAYYLFIYEIFLDVRLVGAPPSSVGKFGGDTDNWMWPRHTGDFSMFRVYMGKDGKPAEYSKENVPYVPKHFLPVSLKGIEKNDFAMVMGYPGGTERYMSSAGIKFSYELSNPARIKLREKRLALMKEDMDANQEVKIKYASKYAQVSNYYKYFIGQNQGLRKLKVIQRKADEEQKFKNWYTEDEERKGMYGTVLDEFASVYKELRKVILSRIYLEEAAFASELLLAAYKTDAVFRSLGDKATEKETEALIKEMDANAKAYFKDFNLATDRKIMVALLKMYYQDIPKPLQPDVFRQVEKKYKGDFDKFAAAIYEKSIFASQEKWAAFAQSPSLKVLEKDPAYLVMQSIILNYRKNIAPYYNEMLGKLDKANNLYLHGILEMRQGQKLYPDANFTMRLTYGTVEDCVPGDAIYYNYYTTLDGIIQKEDSTNEEFIVPAKLKELYLKKDFGQYADKKGYMPVCFITNNDITGGNSGSPVINAEGHLIGLAFDGNWEAMSGDLIFEPNLQRCISVDIRYVLFMIDKYADAGHLINEMKLIK